MTAERPRWRFTRFLGCCALLSVVIGVVLHLTLRDRFGPPWSTIFYALPRPLLCVLMLVGLRALPRPRRHVGWLAFAGLALWTLDNDTEWKSQRTSPTAVRVAFLNAGDLPRGREITARTVASWNADIIGLAEAGHLRPPDLAEWERLLPGYRAASRGEGILFLARGEIRIDEPVWLQACSTAHPAEVVIRGDTWSVVIADVTGQLDLPRRDGLTRLGEWVNARADRPLLVLGDLNTPDDSLWFRTLRQTCRPAIRERGRGYTPTWPVPVPVLLLDYVWANRRVEILSCHHGWTTCSDHRPVLTTVTTATTAATPANSPQK